MKNNRRAFILNSTAVFTLLGLGFFPTAGRVEEWQQNWFRDGRTIDEIFAALGVNKPLVDRRVVIQAPDTAENGAYVGIGIESSIPDINAVAFFVEKNPTVLAGYFEIKNSSKLKFATKIKMAETSNLVALIKAGDSYLMNTRHIKVVLGGCGS